MFSFFSAEAANDNVTQLGGNQQKHQVLLFSSVTSGLKGNSKFHWFISPSQTSQCPFRRKGDMVHHVIYCGMNTRGEAHWSLQTVLQVCAVFLQLRSPGNWRVQLQGETLMSPLGRQSTGFAVAVLVRHVLAEFTALHHVLQYLLCHVAC